MASALIHRFKHALTLKGKTPRGGLCATCREENRLYPLLENEENWLGERDQWRHTGTLRDLIRDQPCSFCLMILHLLSSLSAEDFLAENSSKSDEELSRSQYVLVEEDSWLSWLGEANSYGVYFRSSPEIPFRNVGKIFPLLNFRTWFRRTFLQKGFSLEGAPVKKIRNMLLMPSQRTEWKGEVTWAAFEEWIDSLEDCPEMNGTTQVKADFIKRNILVCEETHTLCKELQSEYLSYEPVEIRLIDTENRCLVRANSSYRYVALSYVWGGVNSFQTTSNLVAALEEPGGIERVFSQIPKTVQDAYTLAKRLDIQYLWVDALCIVQDNDAEKLPQIQNMHIIYSHALVTKSPPLVVGTPL